MPSPPFPLERWFRMSPEQRERALQKLPPERQKRIREQLARFGSLPDAERERLSRRWERFAGLPSDKQELVRRQIRRFNRVPDERRRVLAGEFRLLRGMPEAERRARVEGEEFRSLYSAEEQRMLQDLADNLSPAPK